MKRIAILLFFHLILFCDYSYSQSKIIEGIVKSTTGEDLVGITVAVKNKDIGTYTTDGGKYSIEGLIVGDTLVFSSIGYNTQFIPYHSQQLIDVVLESKSALIDEVVVVGYGEQKQVTVTGSVSTVSGEVLQRAPVSNVSNMLIGNVAGVSGVQMGGEPGRNAADIHIRGVSTYGGQSPLVVIDGVQQPTSQPFIQLNNIDANEIESISILKDASATAVYGVRGANGVIIVTTKRGKSGKIRVNLSTNYAFTRATTMMHNVNSYDYATMRNEAIYTAQLSGDHSFDAFLFSESDLTKFKEGRDYLPDEIDVMNISDEDKEKLLNSPPVYYGSHDWMEEIFGGIGPQKQINLNLSGGSDRVQYFTSIGYFDQGTILKNTSYAGSSTQSTFRRYNFRSNFDVNVLKDFKISIDLASQFSETQGPGANRASPGDSKTRYETIMQWIYESNPFEVPGIVDGHLVNTYAGEAGTLADPLGLKVGSARGSSNAIYNLLSSGNETIHNTLVTGRINLQYDLSSITRGLKSHAAVNYQNDYYKTVKYLPVIPTYSMRRNMDNPNILEFYGGAISKHTFNSNPGNNSVFYKIDYEAGFDYNRSFDLHNVGGLLLGTAQKYVMPSDLFNTPSGLMGFVGRMTYDYSQRYLLEVNMGYNGTEQFEKGRRFGFFPAVSVGWIPTNESFFEESDMITYLKIRGSYGEVGNDQINVGSSSRRYLYLPSSFSSSEGYYFGSSNGLTTNPYYSGIVEQSIGNPYVTWERAKKSNIGIDGSFFKDRLRFGFDYFKENRDNILTTISTVPAVYGVPQSDAPPDNVGKTTNHGYELELGWHDKVGELSYSIEGNVNYAKNKILYQAEVLNPYSWMDATGFSIGQYKGLVADGFFNNEEELFNRLFNKLTNNIATIGDIRYRDINGDGFIDEKDMVPIGYSNLPRYSMNLKLGFAFKGFDLNILFIGTAKGSKYLNSKMQIPFYKNAGNAFQWQFDGRWTPEKALAGEEITFPRADIGGAYTENNYLTNSLWLISNDFIRLKNVEVGYSFKNKFLRKMSIQALRIYVNGNNIMTWGSQMKSVDPELQETGHPYIYPITQVFNFGASLQF